MISVQKKGGETYVFSSMHMTGEKLNNFTGIAAILRFPVQIDASDDEELDPNQFNDEEDTKEYKKEDLQQIKNLFNDEDLKLVDYQGEDDLEEKKTEETKQH